MSCCSPVFLSACIQMDCHNFRLAIDEGGETLAQAAQRGGGCPIPESFQGQVGWGSEQPDMVKDAPAHCRGMV